MNVKKPIKLGHTYYPLGQAPVQNGIMYEFYSEIPPGVKQVIDFVKGQIAAIGLEPEQGYQFFKLPEHPGIVFGYKWVPSPP